MFVWRNNTKNYFIYLVFILFSTHFMRSVRICMSWIPVQGMRVMFDTSSVATAASGIAVTIRPWYYNGSTSGTKKRQMKKINNREKTNEWFQMAHTRYHRFTTTMSVKCWPLNYRQIECMKKKQREEEREREMDRVRRNIINLTLTLCVFL